MLIRMNNTTTQPTERPLASLRDMGYRFAWTAHSYPRQVEIFKHEETGKLISAVYCGGRMRPGSSWGAEAKFGTHYYRDIQEVRDIQPGRSNDQTRRQRDGIAR